MSEYVKIKREDLADLKECFEFLKKENEELKAEAEAEHEDIGVDLSGFKEMFFPKETEPPYEFAEGEDQEVVSDYDVSEVNEVANLSDIVIDRNS